MQRKIDFMIIGAQKSGTTALFDSLAQHPDVFMPAVKENHYFVNDEFYELGPAYLDTFYPKIPRERVIGGAYVHMLYFTECASRLRLYNPSMKAIVVLRNPIQRAWSAFWFARRNGWEGEETFESALALEDERSAGSVQERAELTYLRHGHYAEQLDVWYDVIGAEQVKVVLSEDLSERGAETLDEIVRWLGLDDSRLIDTNSRRNESSAARWPWLQRSFLLDTPLKRAIRSSIAPSLRHWLRRTLVHPVLRFNVRPFRYPEMAVATRRRLGVHFRAHNARLARLLDRDLGHWT